MYSPSEIYKANRRTFFDHKLDKLESIRGRLIIQILASLLCAALFYRELSNFLDGVITVQSVLIGFSFSVMFFLMSSRERPVDRSEKTSESRESKLRSAKAIKVSEEIFANLAYFNLAALASLITALALLLPPISVALKPLHHLVPATFNSVSQAMHWAGYAAWFLVTFVFYFLLIESGYTFVRIINRVNFLFEQKVKPR